MTALRRIFRGLALTVIGFAVLLLTAAGGLYAWLQTESGRNWAKRQAEAALSTPGESEVLFESLDGPLPYLLKVPELTVADREGVWLKAKGLVLDWRPMSLLRGRFEVALLSAESLEVLRGPTAPEAADEDKGPSLPAVPLEIVVEQVAVEALDFAPVILGEAARFRIEGQSRAQPDGALDARLTIERSDGGSGRLLVDAAYRPAGDELSLTLEVSEPQGGLSAYLLELPGRPAVDLRLAGAGALSDWHGELSAELEGMLRAEAELRLRRGADIAFGVTAKAEVTPSSAELPWPLLAGRQDLALEGTWREPAHLAITTLSLRGEILRLAGAGNLALAEDEIQAHLTVELPGGETLAQSFGAERLDGGRVEVALSGRLSRPKIEADLRVAQLAIDAISAAELKAQARFDSAEDIFEAPPSGALSVSAALQELNIEDDPELQIVLGRSFKTTFDGKLDLAASRLEAERLVLASEAFEVEASGLLRLDDGEGELQARASYFTLSRLDDLVGFGLKGSAELEGPWRIEGLGGRLAGELQGRLLNASSDIAVIGALLSKEATVESKLSLDPAGLTLSQMKLISAVMEAAGELALLKDYEEISGSFRLSLPEAGVLSDALGLALAGPGRVVAHLDGTSAAPKVSGTLSAEALDLEGFGLAGLSVDYRADSLTPPIAGHIDARATSALGTLAAATDLAFDDENLRLTSVEATVPDGAVTGDLVAPLDGGPLVGSLKASFQSLGRILALAGVSGDGQGEAEIKLAAGEGRQSARLGALIENASLTPDESQAPISAARLELELDGRDLTAERAGRFKLRGNDLRWQDLALDGVDLTGDGSPSDVALTLRADGRWIDELSVEAEGRVSLGEDILKAELQRAEGRVLGEAFRLAAPARLEMADESFRLSGLSAGLGSARIAADAAVEPSGLEASLKLDDVPAGLIDLAVPLGLSGRISAEAEVKGPRTGPRGRFSARASDIRTSRLADAPASEIALSGDWKDGRLTLDGAVRAAEAAEARLSADLPLQMERRGLAPSLPSDQPIEGQLSWKGETARLLAFMPLADHRIEGKGDLDIALRGSLEKPQLEGQIAISGAEYESLEAGTLLKDLDLLIELDEDRARITRLAATDGGGGTFSVKGQVAFAPESGFPFELSTELENFHLVRRDEVTGSASGQIRIEGDTEAARVIGRLVTDRVEVSILGTLPPEVVKLDVVEEDGATQPSGKGAESRSPDSYGLGLDLTVEFPQQVFVRGRGLDSEWSGELLVKGSAEEPRVSGQISLVRGRLSVVGKSFDLQSGRIKLPEDPGAEPELDIVAQYEAEDLVVTARVTGPVSSPEIALTSRPQLPQDEIVSRVLFNKGVGNLTAIEAAQLAAAIPELTGGGGGFDIMGFLRQTVGVDVLQVETVEGEKGPTPGVKAGKYVTEEVYLGVKQGTTPESSSVNVEVELTPNISVESEMTQSGQTKSGVKFKLDY